MRITFWATVLVCTLVFACSATCRNRGAGGADGGGVPVSTSGGSSGLAWRRAGSAEMEEGLEGPSLVFIHHSCGSGFLREGGLWRLLEELGLAVYEITYGDGWIGDHTDPRDFPTTFSEHLDEVLKWDLAGADRHDLVAFKSCFPACNVTSEAMLKQYRGYYDMLKPHFAGQPQTFFIAWTAPPLVPAATTPENAARYRKFCEWLVSEWAKGQENVAVFDCNAVLVDGRGMLKAEYRRGESDSHPNAAGNQAVAAAFAAWLPDAVSRWRW